MPKPSSPKLGFIEPEQIAAGVSLQAIQLQKNTPFQATYFQVLPDCQTPMDCHPEQEIWMVLQGNGLLMYQDLAHELSLHDLFYFDKQKLHQVRNTGHEPLIICSIFW